MRSSPNIYDRGFFDRARRLEEPSIHLVVDILLRHFRPRSVVDVGCGTGLYLAGFAARGCAVRGYEGAPAAIRQASLRRKIRHWDLRRPLPARRRFDLCLSIEVAEHLPAAAADTFVRSLTGLADTLFFTAATPGQGSLAIGHLNEQPHHYWREKFRRRGFGWQRGLTGVLRREMAAAGVVWWIPKNLMVFKRLKQNI